MYRPSQTAMLVVPRRSRWSSRHLLGVLAVLATALGLFVLSAGPAAAHAALQETTPADGTNLSAVPSKVTFRFNESMLGFGVTVRVIGPEGDVAAGKATVKGPLVTQGLDPDLPGGSYKVQWRVASKDGHPISGTSSFRLAAAASPQPETATSTPAPATVPATVAPTPTVTIASSPVAEDGGGLNVLAVLAVGALLLAGLVGLVLSRTRRRPS